MRILVFRHVPFEHLGHIGPALRAAGLDWQYLDPQDLASGQALPEAAGLISMGGPMSANDESPPLVREIRILEAAVGKSLPVLGVCLGAQLLARALGARVYPNPVKEIGWFPITWTDGAASDPLFRGFDRPETVFHWHGDTFDLPAGASLLAASQLCRHQAFRFGAAYGLQFHLEVTPQMIAGWLIEDANCGDVRELVDPVDPHAHAARLEEVSAVIFGRWAGLVQKEVQLCA